MSTSQLLFSFRGRLNRQPYWIVSLAILFFFSLVFGYGIWLAFNDEDYLWVFGIVVLIAYIPTIWIALAIAAKRLHDRNKSAWWLLVFYIVPGILQGLGHLVGDLGVVLTIIGLAITVWAIVELGFLRGTVGDNQYGPDPLAGTV
jgi:uncharacterized membrane protein YhaH (DUF805 family)